jgi:hypothetical protein
MSITLRMTVLLALLLTPGRGAAASTSDATSAADAALRAADDASRTLFSMLDEARRGHEPARARCLDEHLSQVHAFARMIGDRRARLREALERGDATQVEVQARVLRTLESQLRDIDREGRACGADPEAGASDD